MYFEFPCPLPAERRTGAGTHSRGRLERRVRACVRVCVCCWEGGSCVVPLLCVPSFVYVPSVPLLSAPVTTILPAAFVFATASSKAFCSASFSSAFRRCAKPSLPSSEAATSQRRQLMALARVARLCGHSFTRPVIIILEDGFQPPFPLAVGNRLLLIALAAAIE